MLILAFAFLIKPQLRISASENYSTADFFNKQEMSPVFNDLNSFNVELLKVTSKLDSEMARGGGDINIIEGTFLASESGVFGATRNMESAGNNGRISLYEVAEGDTLSQIAEMFDISVNTIRWANDIRGEIQPGQTLVILPVNGLTHTVKNGGTISDVARIYDADVSEIALFNGLDENHQLKPGDEIIVPNVNPQAIQQPNQPSQRNVATASPSSQAAPTGMTQRVSSSYYTNPVPGGIITQGLHGFNAVDIAAAYGTPILAAASGRVITSREGGWNGGYGNYIVISHNNGSQTLYSHNSRNIVYVGQYVQQGEVIAFMGSTGLSTGNHLHFEVRGGTNPLTACRVGSVCR